MRSAGTRRITRRAWTLLLCDEAERQGSDAGLTEFRLSTPFTILARSC
jgi:hypothetical protein